MVVYKLSEVICGAQERCRDACGERRGCGAESVCGCRPPTSRWDLGRSSMPPRYGEFDDARVIFCTRACEARTTDTGFHGESTGSLASMRRHCQPRCAGPRFPRHHGFTLVCRRETLEEPPAIAPRNASSPPEGPPSPYATSRPWPFPPRTGTSLVSSTSGVPRGSGIRSPCRRPRSGTSSVKHFPRRSVSQALALAMMASRRSRSRVSRWASWTLFPYR